MKMLSAFRIFKQESLDVQQVISSDWAERRSVLNNNVNLFCWERPINPSITAYLQNIIHKNPDYLELKVCQDDLTVKLNKVQHTWDEVATIDGTDFWEDVRKVVHDFLEFSDDKSGTVHLKLVDDNSCTKFHTDRYTLRLFTTYIGNGTEWLPEDAVNRSGLGTTNEKIVKKPHKIKQLGTGDIGILKGELQIRSKNRFRYGIVHRSPEIEEQGAKRIILRVDI
ncbi:MAG: DUF1826 domain-containing protein [Bacteroidota bacterium]